MKKLLSSPIVQVAIVLAVAAVIITAFVTKQTTELGAVLSTLATVVAAVFIKSRLGSKNDDDDQGGPASGAAVLAFVMLSALIVSQPSCTPEARRSAANTVLDVTQLGCVLANAFVDVPAVKVACRIEDVSDDFLRDLIRSARARAVAGVPPCARDGGVCEAADGGAD